MRKNVRQAMDALFSGKTYENPSIKTCQYGEYQYRVTGNPNDTETLPTVYSYGTHFPLVILDGDTAYVNTEKYSVTTTNQQTGVAVYLHYEGYEPTANNLTQKGYERFAIYRKVRPECWPGGHYSGTYDRPAHHGAQP